MKELYEYREKLIARLREATDEVTVLLEKSDDPFAKVNGEWTAHQIAFHLRGIDQMVYGMRIRRTLSEDNPMFQNFDPEKWMTENYSSDESLNIILNEFSTRMKDLCDLLSQMPQGGWSRLSRHEALGKELTLQLWAERGLAHLEDHLAALKNTPKP